jgi:hypothetical protein
MGELYHDRTIADGLALGFISYPIIKLLSGKGRTISWLMYVLALILVLYFIFSSIRISQLHFLYFSPTKTANSAQQSD